MKARVERLAVGAMTRMRTWFDPPLGPDARPLEVRKAIVDEVVARVEPAGGGRRVFPFKCLWAVVLADTTERRAALEGALADLQGALEQQLAELQAQAPPGFVARVEYVRRPRASWSPGQLFALDYRRDPPDEAIVLPRDQVPVLNAVVIRGTAARSSYALSDRQIRIGRTENPVDEHGRPRHNHIAFVEGADECSRTVGRSHASIRYVAERREYRLFDDGSHNGTRIIREGRVLEVTPRDPVGVTIVSGDEIVVGTAALRVRLTDAG
jgi:hypothetical protein